MSPMSPLGADRPMLFMNAALAAFMLGYVQLVCINRPRDFPIFSSFPAFR